MIGNVIVLSRIASPRVITQAPKFATQLDSGGKACDLAKFKIFSSPNTHRIDIVKCKIIVFNIFVIVSMFDLMVELITIHIMFSPLLFFSSSNV